MSLSKEQAVKKYNDVVRELAEAGYAVQPVLKTHPNALEAMISIRPLTVDELPKKEENVAPEAV